MNITKWCGLLTLGGTALIWGGTAICAKAFDTAPDYSFQEASNVVGRAIAGEPGRLNLVAVDPIGASVLYVDPTAGNDAIGSGTQAAPFRTIAYALKQSKPGTIVQLARGSYTQETGELFPLIVPSGVTLRGDTASKGQTVAIIGGGDFVSPTFARQSVTLVANTDSIIQGVSITNPITRGTGIWVESTNPQIRDSTFSNSNRDGVFITGTGNPVVEKNVFSQNGGNGISIARRASGEIRDNVFQNTGFGLAIGGTSTPRILNNQIVENVDGIYVNDSAQPILRNNTIENNRRDGIVATINAKPNLGSAQQSGNNIIQNNRQYDLHNATGGVLFSIGNTLDPSRVLGNIEFTAPVGTGRFRDVPDAYWAKPFIEALAERGVITGFPDGTFRPNDPVTRAQYAVIVSKAFTPPAKFPRVEFRDVPTNFWGYQVIQSASQGGFLRGYPEGDFKPDQQISRVESLVALSNGLGFPAGNPTVLSRFQDAAQIPSWATGSVAAATERQIVVNYPNVNLLNPGRPATRAEVSALVYQALVNAGQAAPIASPYIVAPVPPNQ